MYSFFFFFNDTAPPEISPLSLHDALPISPARPAGRRAGDGSAWRRRARRRSCCPPRRRLGPAPSLRLDRKSTRLNSSHGYISYAVFCLKKKKQTHEYKQLKHMTE